MGIKAWAEFGMSSTEAIKVFNSLGEAIATLEQQAESQNIVSIPTNMEFAPSEDYNLPKTYNCRNCGAPSQINTRISTYVGSGPPDVSDAPIGAIYIDKDTNKIEMFNSEKKWVHMVNYDEHKTPMVKDNKNTTNCRNCGAPLKSCTCEYCGTRY